MPRDLGDVLHYFLDEPSAADDNGAARPLPQADARIPARGSSPLPMIGVPIGDRDVVRASFVWNLAVEIARAGASAFVVAPAGEGAESLWPEPGRGPLGAEFVLTFAEEMTDLVRVAREVAASAGTLPGEGGLVLVRVPTDWIPRLGDGLLTDWSLLFSSADPRDLVETYAQLERLASGSRDGRLGVTIHGVRRIQEAREAFEGLASACERDLGRALTSYGVLIDDLHVYRSIVNRRPLGLTHPRALATRALQDVARLLLEDARGEGRA